MARLLTQAQFARKTKYSRARISQLVKEGIIQLKKGRIDPAQANVAIEANIDRSRRIKTEARSRGVSNRQMELIPTGFNTDQKKGTGSGGFNTDPQQGILSLTETRQRHEAVKMELSKLKLEIEKGTLVPRYQAEEWLCLIIANAKAQFMGMPKRMAGALAVITDEKEIEHQLRKELRRILEEMGSQSGKETKEDTKVLKHASSATNSL